MLPCVHSFRSPFLSHPYASCLPSPQGKRCRLRSLGLLSRNHSRSYSRSQSLPTRPNRTSRSKVQLSKRLSLLTDLTTSRSRKRLNHIRLQLQIRTQTGRIIRQTLMTPRRCPSRRTGTRIRKTRTWIPTGTSIGWVRGTLNRRNKPSE